MLVTGCAPASTGRLFRDVLDAGLYHLLFALGLLLLAVGTALRGELTGAASAVVAVIQAGVAVVRYRPRGKKDRSKKDLRGKRGPAVRRTPGSKGT